MQKKLIGLFAFAIFVLLVGMQTDSYGCHRGTDHKTKEPCNSDPPSENVDHGQMTIDDTSSNTVVSDLGGPYVHGECVRVDFPDVGSPPGRMLAAIPDGCKVNNGFMREVVVNSIDICKALDPDADGLCEVGMNFSMRTVGALETYYKDMLDGETEAANDAQITVRQKVGKKLQEACIFFHETPGFCTDDVIDSPMVQAIDNDPNDNNPADQWVVNPGGGSLTGCLVKVPKGAQCTEELGTTGVQFTFDLKMN